MNGGGISTSSDAYVINYGDGKLTRVGSSTYKVTFSNGSFGASSSADGANFRVFAKEKPYVAVTDVTLDNDTLSIIEGKTATLKASVLPADATEPGVKWSSDNPEVASVDQDGKITAHQVGGPVTITAESESNPNATKGTCKVTVAPAPPKETYVLTGSLKDGGEYIIVNNKTVGSTSSRALKNPGATSSSNGVTINANNGKTEVTVLEGNRIETSDTDIVWTATPNGEGFYLTNDGDYLEVYQQSLRVFQEPKQGARYWTYDNDQLSHIGGGNPYQMTYGDGTFSSTSDSASVYLFEKAKAAKYTVTFVDENDQEISSAQYDEGTKAADIVKPADPTKAATAEFTYTFAGWDPEIADVTEDATYKATFNAAKNQYTVTFVDHDDTVIKEAVAYDYGTTWATVDKPEEPTWEGHTFSGWTGVPETITANVTVKAAYDTNLYTVAFVDYDDSEISSAEYQAETAWADVVKPEDPKRTGYTFAGWDNVPDKVTADVTVKATYTINKYEVTFVDEDGATVLLAAAEYEYGTKAADIVKPADPTKAATSEFTYTFAGWDPEVADVTAEVTYKAKYTAKPVGTTVTYKLVDAPVDGGEYLIVSANSAGNAYALTNPGGTSDGASMGATAVTIETSGSDKVISTDVENIVWIATKNGEGFNLTNGKDYLEGKSGNVKIYSSQQYAARYWTYTGEQLQHVGGDNTYTVYYSNNSFTSSYNSNSNKVYLFEYVNTSSDPIAVESVSLDKTTAKITVGASTQLKATISPSRATNKNVTWSSSDTKVATVDSTGKVTGVAVGTATITVKTEDGGKTATCEVTVKTSEITVEGKDVLTFTSDVHNTSDNTSANRLDKWLDNVVSKYSRVDMMGFCGDMGSASANESDFWSYTNAVMNIVKGKSITSVYTTGNHEFYNGKYASTSNAVKGNYKVDAKGAEADNSIIYALGTDNWDNNQDNYTSAQVTALTTFLNGAGNSKPIFVITHYPLHSFSSRATTNADQVISALNTAADKNDQTIVVLWGHNHTLSDTNYDEIFEPGERITYKSGSSETLGFYYCAAGCMSDSEYGTGSASVKGKGLVVVADNVDSDGDGYKDLDFAYYDANGTNVTEGYEGGDSGVSYKYAEASSFVLGNEYVVAAANTSTSVNATKYAGSNSHLDVQALTVKTEDGTSYVEVSDSKLVWTATSDGLTNNYDSTNYLYPTSSQGAYSYNRTRELTFEDGLISFVATSEGVEGTVFYMTYANGEFNTTSTKSNATTFRIFANTDQASDPVAVTGVTLDSTTASVAVGKTTKLTATVAPSDATNKKVTWKSSNESVATVSSSGVVTGVAEGTATITVTTNDGSKTATCTVTVTPAPAASTYKLVSSMRNGGEYLIVSSNAAGSAYALQNNGGSSDGTSLAAASVTVVDSSGTKTISTNADELVWKATTNAGGYRLTNGSDYLEGYQGNVLIFSTQKYPARYWTYGSSELIFVNPDTENSSAYNYQFYYSNGFTSTSFRSNSSPSSSNPVYIYEKTDGTTPTPATYTITWMNGDTTLKTEQVEEGTVPSYTGDEPTKAADAQYTYTFSGWDPQVVAVTKDATYTAQFSAKVNEYTITWKNGDTTLATEKVAYGETPAYAGDAPTKAATAEFTYTFSGWDPEPVAVTGDATYTAQFNSVKNQYTVRFVDYDGTELSSQKYEYGTAAADIVKPANPTRAASEQYTYEFAAWTPEIVDVAADATYTATYTETLIDPTVTTFTVTFVDEGGTTILKAAKEYPEGTAVADIEQPATPTKAATAEFTYTFDKWTPELAPVTADVTYKATYKATTNKYKVTFVDEDGTTVLLAAAEYDYGTAAADIVKPATPTKASDAQNVYTFNGWTPEVADVTADATYKATYKATPIQNYVPVESVTLDQTDASVAVGQTVELKATVKPDNASDTHVTWTSSDPSVATVDENGVVTAKTAGEATITATVDGQSATCKITVVVETTWKRIAGGDRYETMELIGQEGFASSAVAVLVTGDNFPDALAASSLAGANNCPVILTKGGALSARAKSELTRLGVKKVYIVGGEGSVSKAVADEVATIASVERIAGSSRQATSLEVAKAVAGSSLDTVVVSSGVKRVKNGKETNFADALSIGPWCYATSTPIVLTGNDKLLTSEQVTALKAMGVKNIVIVGGTASVDDGVAGQLGIASTNVTRLAGADRYETSATIAAWEVLGGMKMTNVAVATGETFPDALAGAALCGTNNSVLLLAKNTSSKTLDMVNKNAGIETGYVLGGESSVSAEIFADLESRTK